MTLDIYTAVTLLAIFSMFVMSIHTVNTQILDSSERRGFLATFLLIMIVAIAEWLGVSMNLWPSQYRLAHAIVKAIEFSLAPTLIIVWTAIIGDIEERRWSWPIMALNAVVEFVSVFGGFIFYIDESNVYHRGRFYWIYIAFYVFALGMLFFEIIYMGRKYQNRELDVLLLIFIFLGTGIAFQLYDSNIRTSWISAAMTGVMFYVYYFNLSLQVDTLTGLLNRRCYETHIANIKYKSAVVSFDIDFFKEINDNYGHPYGDLVLKKVAAEILAAYGRRGLCYRIGGDEFCVVIKKGSLGDNPERVLDSMEERFIAGMAQERVTAPLLPTVSVGYAIHDGGRDISKTIDYADARMYENKNRMKTIKRQRSIQ